MSLSRFQQQYIIQGVEENVREDGRERLDYRHLFVETGILANTNGSARVLLSTTDILVGIKVEIGEPSLEFPNKGQIIFSTECSTSASPEYQGKGGNDVSLRLSRCLERLVQDETLDLGGLIIIPQKQCWTIYVDAVIMVNGGNLEDTLSIAVKAALIDTKIPKVDVINGEIEFSSDPYDVVPLDLTNWPVFITLNKIGTSFVVDASLEEEYCTTGRVIFGINSKGNITFIQKQGFGALDSNSIPEMLCLANKFGVEINKKLLDVIGLQKTLEENGTYVKKGLLGKR